MAAAGPNVSGVVPPDRRRTGGSGFVQQVGSPGNGKGARITTRTASRGRSLGSGPLSSVVSSLKRPRR